MREVTNLHLSELYRIWTEMGYETAELNQRMVRFQNIWFFDNLIGNNLYPLYHEMTNLFSILGNSKDVHW